jgi:hypothetical protein
MPPPVKISLLGPPGSGKTTYLAALQQAVLTADPSLGQWNMIAADEPSRTLLTEWSSRLVNDQMFPGATEPDEMITLRWLFVGNLAGSRYDRRRFRRRRHLRCSFVLDVVDVSGESFADREKYRTVPEAIRAGALRGLQYADGIIYFFDPITERHRHSSSRYLNTALADLTGKMLGRTANHYLPMEVSICVTKFDHPDLFYLARRAGLLNYGPDGMPRVLDKHAETFFDILCGEDPWEDSEHNEESNASAAFVRDSLKHSFDPKKLKYYVTSSIGYRKPAGWNPAEAARLARFDPNDFKNIVIEDGKEKIRGPIHPINVLEPLISLQQRVAAPQT